MSKQVKVVPWQYLSSRFLGHYIMRWGGRFLPRRLTFPVNSPKIGHLADSIFIGWVDPRAVACGKNKFHHCWGLNVAIALVDNGINHSVTVAPVMSNWSIFLLTGQLLHPDMAIILQNTESLHAQNGNGVGKRGVCHCKRGVGGLVTTIQGTLD